MSNPDTVRSIRRRRLRAAACLLLCLGLVACTDVRDLEGTFAGPRVGDSAALRRGFAEAAGARLEVDRVDLGSIAARLTIDGVLDAAEIAPIPGAEADVLASMTFDGAPARVYLAFAATVDGGGDALVMVALYDDPRIEVRVLRGGDTPLYGVFALTRETTAALARGARP